MQFSAAEMSKSREMLGVLRSAPISQRAPRSHRHSSATYSHPCRKQLTKPHQQGSPSALGSAIAHPAAKHPSAAHHSIRSHGGQQQQGGSGAEGGQQSGGGGQAAALRCRCRCQFAGFSRGWA